MSAGIDPARDLIPVAPAEHYHMGGIAVDARGRTSLDGLWAAGEVAATGVHGANRLASNSLLEAVVFAARIAEDISRLPGLRADVPGDEILRANAAAPAAAAARGERDLRKLMSAEVGVVRDADGLARALGQIVRIERDSASVAERNFATAALLIAAAAWRRRESRGGHYRSDHPAADPAQAQRSFLTLQQARAIAREATETSHAHVAAACRA